MVAAVVGARPLVSRHLAQAATVLAVHGCLLSSVDLDCSRGRLRKRHPGSRSAQRGRDNRGMNVVSLPARAGRVRLDVRRRAAGPHASGRATSWSCGPRTPSAARSAGPTTWSRRVIEFPFVNPQTGPFYVEGAEPGDTLAVHFVSIEPSPGLGGVQHRPAVRRADLAPTPRRRCRSRCPEVVWIYEVDRDRRTVTFEAGESDHGVDAAAGPDARHGRGRPGRLRGALVAGARRARRQHGHPGDAGRGHLLPRRQRRGCAVLASATATAARARARPAGSRSRRRWTPSSSST